ncbi:MAG TPA: DUF115 domain-containing protein [Spirochaetota bacterium]|nr:DUF115 domain-containing protein [Spirochaetota bacterium]HOR43377.1 DUF115 domain-containing protein [Spirochaetota bacterium]HOU84828.1 DUF115 domain-containing protein [Spirochaetota bacterium]HPK54874.1 DUF115 domain-containing protein [Spirochaetota bacterium]HQE59222.1 DUF115 domain-containing protein [Spirochaetota bacterium]
MSYRVNFTKDNLPTLSFYDGNKEIRIHSAYMPQKEAEKSVEAFNDNGKNIILVLGAGLGYHLRELSKKYPSKTIIAVEHDEESIRLINEHFPETFNLVKIVNSQNDISYLFESGNFSEFNGFALYTHRPSYLINKNFYDDFVTDINRYASSKISDLLTRIEFEERWVENIITNSNHLKNSLRISSFFGKFKSCPGVIISAGPSLRKSLPLIKSIEEKAVLIAVDTALPVLCKFGIKPHFVMTLDAQKHSIKHFLGCSIPETILVADIVSSPDILNRYDGAKALSTTSKYYIDSNRENKRETTPFAAVIEKYCGEIGDVQSGGSVATSAFDLLLNLGCSSIILFGQDLAYTGREIHSSGTHHNCSWLTITDRFTNLDTINMKIIRKRKIKYMKSCTGSAVVSDYVLNLYKEWFENSSALVKIPVINCASDGAFIENAINISGADLSKYISKKTYPAEIIEKIKSSNYPKCRIDESYKRCLDFLNMSEKMIENGKSLELIDLIDDDNEISQYFSSYLKKTKMYLSRNKNIDSGKRTALFETDILRAIYRLKKTINKTLIRSKGKSDGLS